VEVNVCNLINISSLIKNYHPKKQSTLTKNKDIKLLMKSIENYTGHYANKRALQFMALTSLRSANIRHAKWNQIDFDKKIMIIPKEEMKIEKKRLEDAEDFVLPLATQTIKLLESLRPLTGHGTYIFPSTLGDRPLS
jgi:integrase